MCKRTHIGPNMRMFLLCYISIAIHQMQDLWNTVNPHDGSLSASLPGDPGPAQAPGRPRANWSTIMIVLLSHPRDPQVFTNAFNAYKPSDARWILGFGNACKDYPTYFGKCITHCFLADCGPNCTDSKPPLRTHFVGAVREFTFRMHEVYVHAATKPSGTSCVTSL